MNEQVFSLNWWMSATVGVIFIFAGVQKFIARELWPAQAKRLGAPSFAIPTVPYVEVVLGSLLIAGLAANAVLIASIVALSSFTVLLGSSIGCRGQTALCVLELSLHKANWLEQYCAKFVDARPLGCRAHSLACNRACVDRPRLVYRRRLVRRPLS
jgi:hypothetical protein